MKTIFKLTILAAVIISYQINLGASSSREYLAAFQTPIEFYGKVIDEQGNPIEGATITINVKDKPWVTGSVYTNLSDEEGLFQIKGVKGIGISVWASKTNYYDFDKSKISLDYVSPQSNAQRLPTAKNPALLVLRRRGESQALIYNENRVYFKKDGSPVEINLKQKNPLKGAPRGQGDIIVQCWIYDNGIDTTIYNPYDWKFRLTPINGGLIESNGEFDFMAPENGYQPYYEISMLKSLGKKWQSSISKKSFFIKFKDGNYARINLRVITGSETVEIESFFNPSGSRNLEFDETKQINN